ncbi:imidazolonepropionase [Imperialibacter roseus]|uniref:Imidazolonepropionase n=1 Tax=Imperialibacter roseus TaxID=1324217 RepID=A0ABZ0IL61_9BACT|nr:imidazolonepropionase [Imperialibacter roseus]WOK05229.1 imidazolonepropionase [Imperialibacter roseus]
MHTPQLTGPFKQVVTLANLPTKGPITDDQLQVVPNAGIVLHGDRIVEIVDFEEGTKKRKNVFEMEGDYVAFPGLIDCHTHICFAGSRAKDYQLKVGGAGYQEILKGGGGIHDTVQKTRAATLAELERLVAGRATRHITEGVTTIEVKSGYGLNLADELKMLEAISRTSKEYLLDLIPTCLAAHVKPGEFDQADEYLDFLVNNLLPQVKQEGLSNRVDIFVEDGAFDVALSRKYLTQAKELGFHLTVHADQFSSGGSKLAADIGALSADHLEASTDTDIKHLAGSNTVGVVLPGASMGLGLPFASARKLLDYGGCLAIATDWNPGSAPMGDLLMQAAVLGASQKLSMAETWAGITFRAAKALDLDDRGSLMSGNLADFIAFETTDYREVLYHQGKMKPVAVWKNGRLVE